MRVAGLQVACEHVLTCTGTVDMTRFGAHPTHAKSEHLVIRFLDDPRGTAQYVARRNSGFPHLGFDGEFEGVVPWELDGVHACGDQ